MHFYLGIEEGDPGYPSTRTAIGCCILFIRTRTYTQGPGDLNRSIKLQLKRQLSCYLGGPLETIIMRAPRITGASSCSVASQLFPCPRIPEMCVCAVMLVCVCVCVCASMCPCELDNVREQTVSFALSLSKSDCRQLPSSYPS